MRPWIRNLCFTMAGLGSLLLLVLLGVCLVFTAQYFSADPTDQQLVQEVRQAPSSVTVMPGKVMLSLSSAAVTVKAVPAGGPIRVESNFDPAVFELEQEIEEDGAGGWTYRLDFHERTLFHVSVVSTWLGNRSPEVSIELPMDLPLSLDAKMEGGYLVLDLAGLSLIDADVELDRGVLGITVSEPLEIPMERLIVKGRIGTMFLRALGNASPRQLRVQHRLGAASVNLDGMWQADAAVDYQVELGKGDLLLPGGVEIRGLDMRMPQPSRTAGDETHVPTLHITTDIDPEEIRVADHETDQ